MRTKIILLAILALITVYFLLNMDPQEDATNTDIKKVIINPDTSLSPINQIEQVTNETPKQIITSETSPTLITELTYSPDPVVNAYTIFRINQLCYSQLENSNNPSIYMQQFLERMDTKQAEYFKNYLEYCRNLDKQHPEYSLTNKDIVIEQMKNAKPISLWGKIINKEIEVEDLTHNEIQELLKSNDVIILQEAPRYLESYYQEVIHWDLENFLGNHDYDYINYIQQYAHQMYLCNLGADCEATSTIMASLCYRDQTACGLDFFSFINNSLTQGQRADIQLTLTYLRRQYL